MLYYNNSLGNISVLSTVFKISTILNQPAVSNQPVTATTLGDVEVSPPRLQSGNLLNELAGRLSRHTFYRC